jgi:hypothetical protein
VGESSTELFFYYNILLNPFKTSLEATLASAFELIDKFGIILNANDLS